MFDDELLTGILLLTDVNNRDHSYAKEVTSIDLTEWQHRVRNDSSAFMELCDTLHLVPDVWSLYEWSDWLTPVSVGHRRFDTIFYICCMKKHPSVRVDNAEVVKPIVSAFSKLQISFSFFNSSGVYHLKFSKSIKKRKCSLHHHRFMSYHECCILKS